MIYYQSDAIAKLCKLTYEVRDNATYQAMLQNDGGADAVFAGTQRKGRGDLSGRPAHRALPHSDGQGHGHHTRKHRKRHHAPHKTAAHAPLNICYFSIYAKAHCCCRVNISHLIPSLPRNCEIAVQCPDADALRARRMSLGESARALGFNESPMLCAL